MKLLAAKTAFAAVLVTFLFAAAAYSQRPVLGGYKAAKVTEADVKEAAEFAVSTQAEKEEVEMELSKIIKAERQAVAGVNFRLCLEVDSEGGEGQDPVTIFVQAVVNRDLKGDWKLVSWAISECGESE